MLCISTAYMPCGVHLSVRPSVCLSRSWILSKRIICVSSNFFFTIEPHHSRAIVFPYQTLAIFRRGLPDGGVECRWGIGKNRDSQPIWLYRVLYTVWLPSAIHTSAATDRGKLTTTVAGKWRRLFFTGSTKCLWQEATTRERHLRYA